MFAYDAEEAQWALSYHQPEESKYIANEEPIFMQIMDVLRNKGLTDDEQTRIIHLYVEATYAKFWEGWHSHAIAEANQIIAKSKAVSA
jgi:vesicle coat complex subunit